MRKPKPQRSLTPCARISATPPSIPLSTATAIYPKPNLSRPFAGHKKYPYLLKGLAITRPNQVWGTDITYIRLSQGFAYLVAFLDWFSRYVVSWTLSVTLDVSFCLEALDEAIRCHGRPDILNSDQGVQFTSAAFTSRLESAGAKVSMDGKGRCLDNVFVERLWRTVKYEYVYLWRPEVVPALQQGTIDGVSAALNLPDGSAFGGGSIWLRKVE